MNDKLAEVLRLISVVNTEDGLDCEELETLERIVAALNKPRKTASYCAPLPKTSPYYALADKLADVVLGEMLPLDVYSEDDVLIIPKCEVIHIGMLTCLAAYLIKDRSVKIDPSPIRNKIIDVYDRWLNN